MIKDKINWKPRWTIRRFANEKDYRAGRIYTPEEAAGHFGREQISEVEGNLLLNEGITVALQLIGGIAATAFANASAYLGVGDSSTAAAATQTALQAATNKAYVAMSASYPQVSDQTITFRAAFTGAVANFAWNEMTVANGNSDSASNLNRVVSAQGTKTAGQTWTLDLTITLS